MKIRITLKDPDGVGDSINDAVRNAGYGDPEELREEVISKCSKWIRYSEYITIEIDTETREAIVVPAQ